MRQESTKIVTKFDSVEEACCYIALYAGVGRHTPAGQALATHVAGYDGIGNKRDALREALDFVADHFGGTPKGEAVPTYCHGGADSLGTFSRIADMPTRYLVNVLRMEANRQVLGLRSAIRRELQKRGEGL